MRDESGGKERRDETRAGGGVRKVCRWEVGKMGREESRREVKTVGGR